MWDQIIIIIISCLNAASDHDAIVCNKLKNAEVHICTLYQGTDEGQRFHIRKQLCSLSDS